MRDRARFPVEARTCCRCEKHYDSESVGSLAGIGWTPLISGWSCPARSRARAQRVDEMARALVANHPARLWLGTNEHTRYDDCVICEVIARATDLVLSAPNPAPGPSKRTEVPGA